MLDTTPPERLPGQTDAEYNAAVALALALANAIIYTTEQKVIANANASTARAFAAATNAAVKLAANAVVYLPLNSSALTRENAINNVKTKAYEYVSAATSSFTAANAYLVATKNLYNAIVASGLSTETDRSTASMDVNNATVLVEVALNEYYRAKSRYAPFEYGWVTSIGNCATFKKIYGFNHPKCGIVSTVF
jgi:hypothetical protein